MKKIFSTSLIILGIGLFFASPVFANSNLVIEVWDESQSKFVLLDSNPLFSEANFLPGQDVTHLVRVTNNSGQTKRIATEAINVSDPYNLGTVLNLKIKEGGTTFYNKPLSTFFNAGEEFLSNLANSGSITYDFSVGFYSGAQNTFQGESLGFDILIGFQEEGGGILPGAGGGGGGFLPPGLTIREPVTVTPAQTSVTIDWETNYASTSQVIYAVEGEIYSFNLTQPNYGYPHASPEDLTKVTAHSVTISGLTPGTTYYYRCVSHASLAVSTEYSFTTLTEIGEKEEPVEEFEEVRPLENSDDEEVVRGRTSTEAEEEPFYAEATEGKEERLLEIPSFVEVQEAGEAGLGWLLAAIGDLFRLENLWWLLLLLIIIIIILYWLSRKKKRKEE